MFSKLKSKTNNPLKNLHKLLADMVKTANNNNSLLYGREGAF